MPTPLRSVRLSDEAWDFLEGLKVVYGTADKGMLAVSRICTPEVLAADLGIDVEPSKPEVVGSLKDVIQNIETRTAPVTQESKPKARAESVAERKAREQREHVAALAESDTLARAVGREDIEYDPENSPHRSGPLYVAPSTRTPKPKYQVVERHSKPLNRPCGTTASKKSREQK